MTNSSSTDGLNYDAWEGINEVPPRLMDQVSRLVARVCDAPAASIIIAALAGSAVWKGHEPSWPLVCVCMIIGALDVVRMLLNRQGNAKRTKGAKTAPSKSGDDG